MQGFSGGTASSLNPSTLNGSLLAIGERTAKTVDDRYDAQPGEVLHQRQLSPLALLGENPFLHYYGDYSAPAYYLIGAALHFARTGHAEAFGAIRDKLEATLACMDRDADADIDGDGFYAYRTRAGEKGLKNQGWKDSSEAILYPDGSFVRDPIAVAEVQGLFFAAKQGIALVYAALGESERAERLLAEAAALKKRFNERFWMADVRYFALALGPDGNQVKTIASNAGLCLASGIVDDDEARAVVDRLMAPDMFSGWGGAHAFERPSRLQSARLSPGIGLAGGQRARLRGLQALRFRRRAASPRQGPDRRDQPLRLRPSSGSVRRPSS
jgi:glycogen debranching enzyme